MTFEEWRKSRVEVENLNIATEGGTENEGRGYVYSGGSYIEIIRYQGQTAYGVDLGGENHRTFSDVAIAEQVLWDEWADGEINGR